MGAVIPLQADAIIQYSTYLAKGVSTGNAEPQWSYEHMLVAAEERDAAWRARTINSQEMPAWQTGPDVSQYLAAWGADGWEAVGMTIANGQMFILLRRAVAIAPRPAPREAGRGLSTVER